MNKSDKHKCIDCKKIIDYRNIRCQKCWGKSIRKELPNCIDCGKKVSKYNVKRCFSCHHKWARGENSPMKGKKISQSIRIKISKAHKRLGTNKGRKNGMFGKPTPHGKRIKYKNILFRSSYEVAYAKYLDKQGIKWLYEPKTFDLGNTTYTPDFYLPESDTYIEIKGYWRDDAKKKFKMFKNKYNNKIKLVTGKDLKCLNLL
jgi:hypothetical protein